MGHRECPGWGLSCQAGERVGGGPGDLLQEGGKHASLGQGATWEDLGDFHSSCGLFLSPAFSLQGLFFAAPRLHPCTEEAWPLPPLRTCPEVTCLSAPFSHQSLPLCLEHVLPEVSAGEGESICSGTHKASLEAQPNLLVL